MKTKSKKCLECKEIFYKKDNTSQSDFNKRKYCSKKCSLKNTSINKQNFKHSTGHIPWNKGLSVRLSPKSEFKKGENIGVSHKLWKGEDAGIKSIHKWVRRHKGKAKKCLHCNINYNKTVIDWANIDHKYTRNLDDYISLCRKCHRKYDIENNGYVMPSRWNTN